MSIDSYKEENLPDMLPLYYNRLFPQTLFNKWLCYGEPNNLDKREISFTLCGDVYLRFLSFKKMEDFALALHQKFPIKIDIGAVYNFPLANGRKIRDSIPVEREVVFDIDMTDYDDIRTCCSGADVCSKCWVFMNIACKILDLGLREYFGFNHILWVFSGRRGIHCWVADKQARQLSDMGRSSIAEYFQVLPGGRKCKLQRKGCYQLIQDSLNIINQYFEKHILIGQDILGNPKRLTAFLNNIESNIRGEFNDAMLKVNTTVERWSVFEKTFHKLQRDQKILKGQQNLIEEMKLYYSYPRLDINVTKNTNHLLKAPFCVHPKTGKISVPFKAQFVDSFDPSQVPTIHQLIEEVNAYDAKTKELEQSGEGPTPSKVSKIKDYKKTSLLKPITIFNEFLRNIQVATIKENSAKNCSF